MTGMEIKWARGKCIANALLSALLNFLVGSGTDLISLLILLFLFFLMGDAV